MKRKLIIIDEEVHSSAVMLSLINYLKESNKYIIDSYDSVDEAKTSLTVVQYDYIILDIMMPHKSIYPSEKTKGGLDTGIFFFKDLRLGKFGDINKSTRVIIYTNVDKDSVTLKLKDSINDLSIISKPYKYEIEKILSKHYE